MLPDKYVMLKGWPFRSGASWSEKHACVPRHSLAVHSHVLIAAQCWLLSSTVCSSKYSAGARAGAGAASARCMAACKELLVWTWTHSSAGHSSMMMRTSLLMKDMAMWQCNCLCCVGPIEKDLICCFLATGMHTAPLWLDFIVNLSDHFLSGPCPPLEKVCRGGTALDMGLHAIRP